MPINFPNDGNSTGTNNPLNDMYSGFTAQTNRTYTLKAGDLSQSLNQNIYDPAGDASRPLKGLQGPWVNPQDYKQSGDQYFRYNQMMMTFAQNFDPFVQRKEIASPRWWFSRIPRGAFQLFNGLVHETRIYRGGLTTYAGLSQWEDIDPYPDGTHDPCAPMKYDTYTYAWETLAWKGKRAGWGSDPICLDTLKFVNQAVEQLGWILETGANYGIDMQEVWNRDMFIYQSVQAGHSFVMSSESPDLLNSPRYIYNPFVKFGTTEADGTANKTYADKPFIVIDASVKIEPLNFDVLDQVREYLKTQCPEAAVGHIGGEPMFALAVSHDDVERYIRGNEEERKYWIEANPQALITHYGFAPSTFRRWTITNDGNQLRFKLKRHIASYTAAEALHYGNVGKKEFENKPVWIAEYVPPRIEGRVGINGAGVPTVNPAYYTAELAIAPVFMNKIFTNLFVPSVNTLGSGTYFGPVTGLNGKWAWRNIISEDKNPEGKIGNFYGTFEIVPKPDTCVFECFSYLYQRCVTNVPSICPIENAEINKPFTTDAAKLDKALVLKANDTTATIHLDAMPKGVGAGDTVTIAYKVGEADKTLTGLVFRLPTVHTMDIQFEKITSATAGTIAAGTAVTVA